MSPKLKDYFFSFLSIIVNVCSNIIIVPLYIRYFGTIDYGVWVIVNTVLQYLMLSNFGIPTALTTIATNATATEDILLVFKKSFKLICVIAVMLITIIGALYFANLIPHHILFGETKKSHFYTTILVLAVVFYLVRSPFQLSSSVFLMLGKVAVSKVYEIANNLIIPLSFAITYFYNGNIMLYAICWSGLLLLSSIVMFFHARVHLIRNFAHNIHDKISSFGYKSIIKTSFGYFFVSIGALLVWNTDNFVIVNVLGVDYVTSYSLTFRIFTAFFAVLMTINSVMLPFYGKYNSNKDYVSIQQHFDNSLLIMMLVSGTLCVFIFLFSEEIFLMWTKNPSLYVGKNIFLLFGFYTLILSCLNSMSTLLSALKRVKLLIACTFIEGLINLIISLILIKKIGLIGVAAGTLIGSLCSFLLICIFFKKDILIPVKIPLKRLISNFAIVLAFSAFLLFINIQTMSVLVKFVTFSVFFTIYLTANFKGIRPLLKFRK